MGTRNAAAGERDRRRCRLRNAARADRQPVDREGRRNRRRVVEALRNDHLRNRNRDESRRRLQLASLSAVEVKSTRPVAARFYGVFTDGGMKIRGLACRRRDTPQFIKEAQEEMLDVLSMAQNVEELR